MSPLTSLTKNAGSIPAHWTAPENTVCCIHLLLPQEHCPHEHRALWCMRERGVCRPRAPVQVRSQGSFWTTAQAKQQLIYYSIDSPPRSKLAGILTGNSIELLQQKHAHGRQRQALPSSKHKHKELGPRKTPSKGSQPHRPACPANKKAQEQASAEQTPQDRGEGKYQQRSNTLAKVRDSGAVRLNCLLSVSICKAFQIPYICFINKDTQQHLDIFILGRTFLFSTLMAQKSNRLLLSRICTLYKCATFVAQQKLIL